ncbi:glycoside hydrolase family 113 [Aquimarina amphilecti]|nr:hypothetical protein [Aquimarina amphilecti]
MKKELFTTLSIYICNWIISLVLFVIVAMVTAGVTFLDSFKYFVEALDRTNFLIAIHVLFVILYFLFLILRYFIRIRKKKGFKLMIKQLSLRLFTPVFLLFGTYQFIIIKNSSENFQYNWIPAVENNSGVSKDLYQIDGKHRGMSVFGWNRDKDNANAINDLIKSNIEWVAVIPFLDQENEQTLTMRVPKEIGRWSRRDSLHIKTINALKKKNIHIMLKPHLWLSSGWRSNITHSNELNWNIWFESYRANMIHYAKIAALTEVELFCIGTELKSSLKAQPDKWKSLVKEIKNIYKGKLTYAANWDGEYELIDFWNEMDYIGIQAYFPLTQNQNPDITTVKKGWETHINMLKPLSEKHNKPILFTEVGYKSEASGTIRPWEWGSALSILSKQKSDKTQQIAFEALYQELWNEEWFAGTYIWQWNIRSKKENAAKDLDFSPRYKAAENTIAKWYSTNNCD